MTTAKRSKEDILDIKLTMGGRIRHAREFEGLTQREMASELHISKRQYIRYEQDEVVPTLALVERIAGMTNSNPDWILYGSGSMRRTLFGQETRKTSSVHNEWVYSLDGMRVFFRPKDDGVEITSQAELTITQSSRSIVIAPKK